MSVSQSMISKPNILKPPQYVTEGHTPAAFGVTPASPNFYCPTQMGWCAKNIEVSTYDNMYGGTIYRQGRVRDRQTNGITLTTRFLGADIEGLLKWAANPPDGAGTPDESRTWMWSYRNSAGNEVYCVAQGCKPTGFTVSIPRDGPATLEIPMMCHEYTESTDSPSANGSKTAMLASATYDAEDGDALALKFADVGSLLWQHTGAPGGGVNLNWRSLTITGTWSMRRQDSNGSYTDLFFDHSGITVSGSVDIFKQGAELNNAAIANTQAIAALVLGQSTTADTQATKDIIGSGANKVTISSKLPGAAGNRISVRVRGNLTGRTVTEVRRTDYDVEIYLKSSGDTYAKIRDAWNASSAGAFGTCTVTGSGNTNTSVPRTNLTGGTDGNAKIVLDRLVWEPSDENILEQSEATIESKSYNADVVIVSPKS